MTILYNQTITNLENSLFEFIDGEIQTASLQVIKEGKPQDVIARVGSKVDRDWSLPVIQLYYDSKTAPRLELGSNKRLKQHLMIIDVRADNGFNRDNISDWVEEIVNDGFPLYQYTANGATPIKTLLGQVSFEFVNIQRVNFGEDVDLYDKYRSRISINCYIQCN